MGRHLELIKTWLNQLLTWATTDKSDLYMSRSWLEDKSRLRQHEEYTLRQHDQGSVTKNAQHFRNEAFWNMIEAKRSTPRLKILGGRFK